MEKYNVSVVIPMYNAESTILRAINSVFMQDYDGIIEVIVINDGSTDGSLSIVTSISDIPINCTLEVLNQRNRGVSSARNLGIEKASFDWICFLDSDDEWLPHKLSSQVLVLKTNPFIDFLGCNLLHQEYNFFWKRSKPLMKIKWWELLLKMHPQTSTVIVRKKVLQDIGMYDENMTHAEDGDLWIRICLNYNFYFSTKSLVIYDNGKSGFGASGLAGNISKMHYGTLYTLRKLKEKHQLSQTQYLLFHIYYIIKYYRRKIILFYSHV